VGDFDILDDLIIQGASAADTVIDGNNLDRVLDIRENSAQISHLTIQHGYRPDIYSNGGGLRIQSVASVTLTHCVVTDNVVAGSYGKGAGIGNYGILTIEDSVISHNRTYGSLGNGGGIYSSQSLVLNHSIVTQNLTEGFGANGAGWLRSRSGLPDTPAPDPDPARV
jgi:hypothetical protein